MLHALLRSSSLDHLPPDKTKQTVSYLVNWYFEPSQPRRITSRLKNVQSVSYLFCTRVIKPQIIQKPLNQSCTQIYIKQSIHKHRTQNFRRISPFGITPVKKALKARTRWYRGPFRRLINTKQTKQNSCSYNRLVRTAESSLLSSLSPSVFLPLLSLFLNFCFGGGGGVILLFYTIARVKFVIFRISGANLTFSLAS